MVGDNVCCRLPGRGGFGAGDVRCGVQKASSPAAPAAAARPEARHECHTWRTGFTFDKHDVIRHPPYRTEAGIERVGEEAQPIWSVRCQRMTVTAGSCTRIGQPVCTNQPLSSSSSLAKRRLRVACCHCCPLTACNLALQIFQQLVPGWALQAGRQGTRPVTSWHVSDTHAGTHCDRTVAFMLHCCSYAAFMSSCSRTCAV